MSTYYVKHASIHISGPVTIFSQTVNLDNIEKYKFNLMFYKNGREMEKTFQTDFQHHNEKQAGLRGKESRKMHSHPSFSNQALYKGTV